MATKINIGSQWIIRHSWGDVNDICITPDNEKKTIYTVQNIVGNNILYTIAYAGNPTPKKIHTETKEQFLIDLKEKPAKQKRVDDYQIGDSVEVWMNTDTDGVNEWRTAKVVDKKHVSASGYSYDRHGAYSYPMVEVIRTYCKGEWNNLTFYDKVNIEGWLCDTQIKEN